MRSSISISLKNLGLEDSLLSHNLNETVSDEPDVRIPLHRINSTFEHEKSFTWAGHMIYFKNDEENVRKQYWVINSKLIRIFKNSNREIELERVNIESVRSLSMYEFNVTDRECIFTMEIHDAKYYCGIESFAENSVEKNMIKILAENCYKMLKLTNMPYLNIKRKLPFFGILYGIFYSKNHHFSLLTN